MEVASDEQLTGGVVSVLGCLLLSFRHESIIKALNFLFDERFYIKCSMCIIFNQYIRSELSIILLYK